MGEKLSDDVLMKVIREEGDSKGTLKLLAQHTAVSGHLSPSREFVPPHVPPVFSYPGPYGSSGKYKAPSNHDSKSSTSEPFAGEQHNGYDGSASDDIDRFGLSPSRESPGYHYILNRNRPSPSLPPYGNSPASARFDESTLMHPPPPPRGKHSHSGSETAADRERALEASEKRAEELSRRKDDRGRQDPGPGRSTRAVGEYCPLCGLDKILQFLFPKIALQLETLARPQVLLKLASEHPLICIPRIADAIPHKVTPHIDPLYLPFLLVLVVHRPGTQASLSRLTFIRVLPQIRPKAVHLPSVKTVYVHIPRVWAI